MTPQTSSDSVPSSPRVSWGRHFRHRCCHSAFHESFQTAPCIPKFSPSFAITRHGWTSPRVNEDERTTTASADFSRSIPRRCRRGGPGSSEQNERPPRVSCVSFARASPDLPSSPTEWLSGVPVHCRVTRRRWPYIRFLFVESELGASASFRFRLVADTLA